MPMYTKRKYWKHGLVERWKDNPEGSVGNNASFTHRTCTLYVQFNIGIDINKIHSFSFLLIKKHRLNTKYVRKVNK